jgi:hypothetical protein
MMYHMYLDYGPDPSSKRFAFVKYNPPNDVYFIHYGTMSAAGAMNLDNDLLFGGAGAAFIANVNTYTMNLATYNATATLGAIDTRKLTQESDKGETMRKHARIRQVALDMSADGPVAIDVQCRDKEGTFETVKTITLTDNEYQYHQVGVDRPGFYPQFRLTSNAATRRWVLRGIEYFGDMQGMR